MSSFDPAVQTITGFIGLTGQHVRPLPTGTCKPPADPTDEAFDTTFLVWEEIFFAPQRENARLVHCGLRTVAAGNAEAARPAFDLLTKLANSSLLPRVERKAAESLLCDVVRFFEMWLPSQAIKREKVIRPTGAEGDTGTAGGSTSTSAEQSQHETTKDRNAILSGCTDSPRKAYLSFKYAEFKKEKQLEDRPAYDWLKEHGCDDAEGLADYKLPVLDTWSRYVREVRNKLGEQKYQPRAGRATGGSVVRAADL